jgi:anti-anti-sigma factor
MATADEARVQLWAYAATSEGDVVCDCTDLEFLDSSGISMLVALHRELAGCGKTLRLTNLAPLPTRTLQVCGLVDYFGITVGPPKGLTSAAVALLQHMADRDPYPIVAEAASETGMSPSSAQAAMRELCDAGYVQLAPACRTRPTRFRITASGRRAAARLAFESRPAAGPQSHAWPQAST